MGAKLPYVRRQYLVDRGFQIRFVTRVFAAVLAVGIISSLLSTSLLWTSMYRPELGSTTLLVGCLVAVAVTLLIELILAVPIVFFLGIKQSHRIVGPIHRITRTLEAIGKGDFSQRLTLRDGDALEGLAKAINKMAEALQRRAPRS